jgi:hypothetical protein
MLGTELQCFHQSSAFGLLKKFLKLMPQPYFAIMFAIWMKV